ncbi:GntR family transcriptional regulator [Rhizobium sp. CG4]|uniref:GntR family transcriptional regulator n=1 Tax=Rhizobium/Agrobacterium group TaxID=227290 RepID=UPI002034A322|nr:MULTISPECIES: GntR family transcriptional regulator [Rhizobium/Agrobacterium group]MCM2457850.1 GntR family transcriptional regulator [Rhizobium sp. CG4]MCS4243325.1 DNA-binding GntR family transcriptional regulator [Rhizobium sp. BIGb0125]MDO5897689.1 GntR family transcriptional regulator [Agrobacterium sp. Azo12]
MAQKPISRENLSTQLYGNLRNALMDGQYAPGQRLTISGVAEEYGTSITPVREAIFRLVSERALEMRAATSVQVPDLSPQSLREVQRIRVELEGVAAARAAELATKADIKALKAINAEFIKAAATSPERASVLNRDFHFAILRLAQLPILESICENMWVLMGPFLRTFHDRMPVRQLSGDNHKHYDLIAALEAGDAQASRAAMQEDILWGEEMVRTLEAERKTAV